MCVRLDVEPPKEDSHFLVNEINYFLLNRIKRIAYQKQDHHLY